MAGVGRGAGSFNRESEKDWMEVGGSGRRGAGSGGVKGGDLGGMAHLVLLKETSMKHDRNAGQSEGGKGK